MPFIESKTENACRAGGRGERPLPRTPPTAGGAHRDAGQQQPGVHVRGQPGAGHLLRFVLTIVKRQGKTKIHSLTGPEMLDCRGVHLQGQWKDRPGSARSVSLSHVSASFQILMNKYESL